MNYTDALSSALVAIRGNVLRSLLTMLGIVIGVSAVIIVIAVVRDWWLRRRGWIR